jgi:hypothetical protein
LTGLPSEVHVGAMNRLAAMHALDDLHGLDH